VNMRSLIIIEVEHGETTDPLVKAVANITYDIALNPPEGVTYNGYSVKVDLPECFTLA